VRGALHLGAPPLPEPLHRAGALDHPRGVPDPRPAPGHRLARRQAGRRPPQRRPPLGDPADAGRPLADRGRVMAAVVPSEVIDGVLLVHPTVHGDERGFFVATYRREGFPRARAVVPGNRGVRVAGCLVGLHYHLHQADYWYVPRGHARVVLHDLRTGSPTDGATLHLDLGEVDGGPNNHLGVYIPPGVAHGFASLTDMTITYL